MVGELQPGARHSLRVGVQALKSCIGPLGNRDGKIIDGKGGGPRLPEINIGENVRTDAGQELPKFAVSYTKDAQAACDKLSEKARAALRTIDNELSVDPTHRATKLDNGTFIYKYPTPAIQLTCKLVGKIVYVIQPALPAAKLFISYSHADKDYLDQLKKYLKEPFTSSDRQASTVSPPRAETPRPNLGLF